MLDVAPHILTAEDRLVAQAMTDAFRHRGIDLVTGIGGVEHIERAGNELALVYKLGGGTETVVAEAVVLSTGWLGDLAGLDLAAAGVETDGRYVLTDNTCRTSAPHIFAAGDIDGRMMLVQALATRRASRSRTRCWAGNIARNTRSCPTAASHSPNTPAWGLRNSRRARNATSPWPSYPTPTWIGR